MEITKTHFQGFVVALMVFSFCKLCYWQFGTGSGSIEYASILAVSLIIYACTVAEK